jgi:hypothetical protein
VLGSALPPTAGTGNSSKAPHRYRRTSRPAAACYVVTALVQLDDYLAPRTRLSARHAGELLARRAYSGCTFGQVTSVAEAVSEEPIEAEQMGLGQ